LALPVAGYEADPMARINVAVLDDYQSLSNPHFDRLRQAGYQVTVFTDTLLPYNHPETSQDVKDALVRRLEPFDVICEFHRCPQPLRGRRSHFTSARECESENE
jgi:hypothetical protein